MSVSVLDKYTYIDFLPGMLEVFVELLKSYSDYLEDSNKASFKSHLPTLGQTVIGGLVEVLSASNANCAVFRELGGSKTVISLVKNDESRPSAILLLQQLILASGGDDDMTALLELLHTSPQTSIVIKSDILHALITCLRESHRSRAFFR